MAIKKIWLIVLGFFCFSNSVAQQSLENTDELLLKNRTYFDLNSPSLFLHLNKTTFLQKEELWFTAYSYFNEFQKPNSGPFNLRVMILNDQGEILEKKFVFMEEGAGTGSFKIHKDLYPPGTYFIKASSNYLKNFNEDLSYSQAFIILGQKKDQREEKSYDLQLLPESGHLVRDVRSTIAVKLIDNTGKGVRFSRGRLINEKGIEIKAFESNLLGLGKFEVTPTFGKKYKIRITTAYGDQLEKELPPAQPEGLVLSSKVLRFGQREFGVRTNLETFNKQKEEPFYIAIHQEEKMKVLPFSLNENLETKITFTQKALFRGTNIITILNGDLQPLAERMVFNRDGILRRRINATFIEKNFDSLKISLTTEEKLDNHQLSISVLPEGTKSYNPKNNIFSAVYLEPFISGEIENGAYYFSGSGSIRRKDGDLDLLLMAQGWSRYSWDDIFNNPPTEKYPVQAGFQISGKVVGKISKNENQIAITSPASNLFEITSLQKDGKFELEHLYLLKDSEISFTLINEKKNRTSIPKINFQIRPVLKTDTLLQVPGKSSDLLIPSPGQTAAFVDIPEAFLRDAELLDTVHLHTRIYKTEGNAIYLNESSTTTKAEISEKDEEAFYWITDYIRFHGFRVLRNQGGVMIYSNRARLQIKGDGNGPIPTVSIDGMQIRVHTNTITGKQEADFTRLAQLTTRDVKSITINKSGAGMGFGGAGGWIKIETRKSSRTYDDKSALPKYNLNDGFVANKEFYTPRYTSYSSNYFREYGTVGWVGTFRLEEGKAEFNLLDTFQKELLLFIEGLTPGGFLISEVIKIDTSQKPEN